MKCAKCGTERPAGEFCPECGSREIKENVEKEIKCGKCGHIRNKGKFCPECGSTEVYVKPQPIKQSHTFIQPQPAINSKMQQTITPSNYYSQQYYYQNNTQSQQKYEQQPYPVYAGANYYNTGVNHNNAGTNYNNAGTGYNTSGLSYINSDSSYKNTGSSYNADSNYSGSSLSYNSTASSSYNQEYTDQEYDAYRSKPKETASTGGSLIICKLILFLLAAAEFTGMFLPLSSYGIGKLSESISVSDGYSYIVFVGAVIIAILVILAIFSHYIGSAIGLLIQSLILSVASFFAVFLVNTEGPIATKGISYYIFLIVPIAIIVMSIITLCVSIHRKKHS
ncbi:MAG: zinc ribbon domain-containing protein [Eubacterium sp.]|nr:zinc ribbon domain-containing protein [Eubacterium sp.]